VAATRSATGVGRQRVYCRWCHKGFLFEPIQGRPDPQCCGRGSCYAREHWTDEQWAGRARMARGRLASGRRLVIAGIEQDQVYARVFRWTTEGILDDLDREALRRAGNVPP
jgi:hypothetical protein